MTDLADLVAEARRGSDALVEEAIFGPGEPSEVAHRIRSFVAEHLGPVDGALFYRLGVGVVAGLRLADGAEVVVKVHRWNVSPARLRAVHRVQEELAARGLPAPRPRAGPVALGSGLAIIEDHRPGEAADGHDPDVRRNVAEGLHRLVTAASTLGSIPDLGTPESLELPRGALWDEPHDLRFDFEATASGAEWIDELAWSARRRLPTDLPRVVGHLDWRVENLGFDGTEIVAIYDWDSLSLAPEALVVGQAAAGFSSDWRVGQHTLPSVDEMFAFVADYERVREAPFDAHEREVLDAANLLLLAYGSRCQHSDRVLRGVTGRATAGWIRLLEERAERTLFSPTGLDREGMR